jgi:phosphate-selective porin OprO/OprP
MRHRCSTLANGSGRASFAVLFFMLAFFLDLFGSSSNASENESVYFVTDPSAHLLIDGHRSLAGWTPQDNERGEGSEEAKQLTPIVGFDRGFLIASPELDSVSRRDFPFTTRLSGWMQLRHALFESDGPNVDRNAFSLERIRVGLDGHVYSPDLQYVFVLDANSDQAVQVIFLDSFFSYDFGRNLFNWDANRLGFRAGKWKTPFSRSREESARRLQFAERSVANLFFDIGRATGFSLYGENEIASMPIRFETALFNGLNTGRDAVVSAADLDRNFGWSARTSFDPLGSFGEGESDLQWSPKSVLRFGTGIAGSRVDRQGSREFDRQRVVASGQPLAGLLPDTVDFYDIWFYTLDAHWKLRGLSMITEYHWRTLSQFSDGSVPNLSDNGLVLQTGYFLIPRRFEVLARWTKVVGNSGTLGASYERTSEIGTGFVWFMRNQDVKLTADISRIDGVPANSPRLSLQPGDEGWLLRTQLQIGF